MELFGLGYSTSNQSELGMENAIVGEGVCVYIYIKYTKYI